MKRIFRSMIAGALAVPLLVAAGAASADVVDQNKVGAALAVLIVTGEDCGKNGYSGGDVCAVQAGNTVTSAIVTNTSPTESIILAGEVISGDREDHWTGQSFRCPLTPGETTQFVFTSTGSGSTMKYECSDPNADQFSDPNDRSIARTMPTNARNGILWLTIEGRNFPNPTLSKNILEGKSTIIDFADGYAYEVGAVPFQSPAPEAQDFDTKYEFDGLELAEWPESLTTSFHAPEVLPSPAGGALEATLILFTLDGRLSSHDTPNAEAVVYFFNDDEEFFNTSLYFDCFAMLDLEYIDSRFLRRNLGSAVGHLEIIPQSVDPNDANHDAMFGNNDDKRVIPILGWLVQKLPMNSTIVDAQGMLYARNAGNAAWGSLLSTSMTPLPSNSGDTPALRR